MFDSFYTNSKRIDHLNLSHICGALGNTQINKGHAIESCLFVSAVYPHSSVILSSSLP